MENNSRIFGIVGLGIMGGSLAQQAREKGYRVVGLDKFTFPDALREAGVQPARDFVELKQLLPAPRIVFLYVPAGGAVDTLLAEIADVFEAGDIIVDGGNSYWGDSMRRAEALRARDLYWLDCGTSGGMTGARHGACFMIGGDAAAVQKVMPILQDLAVPEGCVYTGKSGSGHFVKLVHNGIEFGMLQAIGEGVSLLRHYQWEQLDLAKVLHCWNHGSVIRSWLVELMEQVCQETMGLEPVPAYVEDTGEVNWLVTDAMRMEVSVPVIAQSVMALIDSRDKDKVVAKAIAMMRHGFGNHPFGMSEKIARERMTGRVGDFPTFPGEHAPAVPAAGNGVS